MHAQSFAPHNVPSLFRLTAAYVFGSIRSRAACTKRMSLLMQWCIAIFFIFHIMFFIFPITFIIFHTVFYEYPLVLVLNRMSKKLKSVTKKLFGGKSRAGTTDTFFRVIVLPLAGEPRSWDTLIHLCWVELFSGADFVVEELRGWLLTILQALVFECF
jgi:hypothetical protein